MKKNIESYEAYVKEQMKSKVYDALFEVATEFPEIQDELHKESMEEAIEWFMVQFYNL